MTVLVLRALGVGDLAVAVPALRGLRTAFPDEPIVLAAPDWLAPLVELTGAVDRLLPLDGVHGLDGAPPLPVGGWRLAVNLHGRGPQSHRLLIDAEPAELLAFACPGLADGPDWVETEREVDRWCRLLASAGLPADPDDLDLIAPPRDGLADGASVLHIGAKDPARRWPVRRFAEVARELAARGHRVVVTGSDAEAGLAREVADAAGLPDGAVLAGRTDLRQLAALVAHARLVIVGDTGVAHLATAYRTPSVVLFAAMDPARWGPPAGRPRHRVLWRPELAALPTSDGTHPGLAAIGVDDVIKAVEEVHAAPAR